MVAVLEDDAAEDAGEDRPRPGAEQLVPHVPQQRDADDEDDHPPDLIGIEDAVGAERPVRQQRQDDQGDQDELHDRLDVRLLHPPRELMEGLAELQQHGDHAAQHDRLGHRPDDHPGADAIHEDGRELGRLSRLGLPLRQPGEIARRHQPRRRQQPHRHHPPAEHLPELPRHRPEQRDQRERPDPRDRRVHPLPLKADQKAEPEGDRELEEGGGEHGGIVWRGGARPYQPWDVQIAKSRLDKSCLGIRLPECIVPADLMNAP